MFEFFAAVAIAKRGMTNALWKYAWHRVASQKNEEKTKLKKRKEKYGEL